MSRLVRRHRAAKAGGEGGFTLIELLIAVVILPLLMGGVAAAVLTLVDNVDTTATHQDPNGTARRLADTHDSQLTSIYFVNDVQSAQSVSTSPSPLCGSGQQLLGLEWTRSDGTKSDVSYSVQSSPLELVRNFCQGGITTPKSTSVVSHDVFTPPPTGVITAGSCPMTGFGAGGTTCAIDSGRHAYVEVLVSCSGTSGASSSDCAAGTYVSQLQILVLDNQANEYEYSLTAAPRIAANGSGCNTSCSLNSLNPPLVVNGPLNLGNCSALVNGITADNANTNPSVTIGPTGSLSGTGVYTTPSGGVSGPAGSYPAPPVQGPPIQSPYDALWEAPAHAGYPQPPAGAPYTEHTETNPVPSPTNWPGVWNTDGSLKQGFYVLPKGLTISGNSGLAAIQGALFYVTGGDVSLSGKGNINVQPLTPNWEYQTQPLPEVVLWISRNDTTGSGPGGAPTLTLGGNGGAVTLDGAVYAPTAITTINGGGSSGGVDAAALDLGSLKACNGGGAVPFNLIAGPQLTTGTVINPTTKSVTYGSANSAMVTVTGTTELEPPVPPTGTVSIYKCGPEPSPEGCANSASPGGPPVGTLLGTYSVSPVAGTNYSTATTGSFTPATPISSGTYCFGAYFAPTAGSPYAASGASSDVLSDGCYTMNPPTTTITTPAAGVTCYGSTRAGGCTVWPGAFAGTNPDDPAATGVTVEIQAPTGLWWTGTAFSSPTAVQVAATMTASDWTGWSLNFPVTDFTTGPTGTYKVTAWTTDSNGLSGPPAAVSFSWRG